MKKPRMKNLLTIMAVSALTISATTTKAQVNLMARSNKEDIGASASAFESADPDPSTNAAAVNERVSKNFTKEFSDATEAVWTKTNDGFVVRFNSNGIQNWAYLTKHGVCESQIAYYSEKELSASVRNLIKRSYQDFDITSVKEVTFENTTIYLVTVADAKTWKVIRVLDGETDVYEEHVKG